MKMTREQIKQIIREQLEEQSESSKGQDLAQRIKEFFQSIKVEAESLGTEISLQDLKSMQYASEDFLNSVRHGRMKALAGQREPEAKKQAAAKGLATKQKNKDRSDKLSAFANGNIDKETGLPMYDDDYDGIPDPEYYEFVGKDPKSGLGSYKLKSRNKDYYAAPEKPIKRVR